RSALAHHVHRTAPMGPRVLINGIWYKAMIAKQEAGASAKVIEGVADPVPALPPPSRKARREVRRSDRADSGLAARVVDAEPTDEVRQPPRDQVSPSKSP